jgi:multiple sugar transport system ATP-binding protein
MLELKILHKKLKTTIIYATRNKAEAMSLGEKICVLKDGGIQQIADNAILYENPANKFVAEFITTPSMNFFSIDVLRKPNGIICFNEGHFELLLTEGLKEKFNIFLGQKLLLAIRPEHIYDKAICDIPFKDSYSLKAKIEIVEPLGSKKYLHLNTGKNKFIMETNRTKEVIEGQEIELVIDYSKMHVFSISDGSRII